MNKIKKNNCLKMKKFWQQFAYKAQGYSYRSINLKMNQVILKDLNL